jgi:hypothetical protein
MRLVVIFGPPAVGKMTVGREVAARSGFRLVHNHAVLEPLLELFDYGTPPFMRLLREFRRRMVEEAAQAEVDLVLTYVWGLELQEDARFMAGQMDIYRAAGGEVFLVELYADLPTRLARNATELRLQFKPSKRNVEWSDRNVRELEQHVMNTTEGEHTPADEVLGRHPHLRIDNTALEPGEVAEGILAWVNQ